MWSPIKGQTVNLKKGHSRARTRVSERRGGKIPEEGGADEGSLAFYANMGSRILGRSESDNTWF